MVKKFTALFLTLLFMGSMTCVYAEDAYIDTTEGVCTEDMSFEDINVGYVEITPFAGVLISSTLVNISASDSTVKVTASIKCKRSVEKLGIKSIVIYEKRSGSWVSVKSSKGQYKEDSLTCSKSITYS